MTGIDLLTIDPADAGAVRRLRSHLTEEERHQLLADLEARNRNHEVVMRDLSASDEWREIEQWRAWILDVTGRERAA